MRRLANEPELSEKQLEEFEQKLESCLADLRVKAGQVTREGREPMDWSAVDVADRAVSGITKEFIFQQAHERHRLLQRVEAALGRIRDGNFGECLACGELIGRKRLEAVPWTEYCVDCQEKRERGELADFNLPGTDTSRRPAGTGPGPNTPSRGERPSSRLTATISICCWAAEPTTSGAAFGRPPRKAQWRTR